MKGRALWIAVLLFLVGTLALVVLLPAPFVGAGKMTKGHESLDADCFACHLPFRGSVAEKCTQCHAVEKIGRFTTRGEILSGERPAFHQQLVENNCTACHAGHISVGQARSPKKFSHDLLQPGVRNDCGVCHTKPADSLHRQLDGSCQQCHVTKAWRPATFDHSRYFLLDRDHDARCTTCHVNSQYSRYTCYGCHEHSPAGIRAEHEEEGVRDFDNCVECHRSADEPRERGQRSGSNGD